MPTEKFLNNLIVNKVDNSDTYKAMQTAGLVNEDEIYLIENPTANSIIEVNKNLEQKFWRGTKAEYDAITEKADDTMYIVTDESEINAATYMAMNVYDPQGKETDIFAYVEEHGGVQSDWDENDPASKAYIQNKPFGYYGKVNSEIFNYNGTFEAESFQTVSDYTKFTEFVVNTEYVVNFDGVEYRYMPVSLPETSDSRISLGYQDGFNTDWPFNIQCQVDIDYGGEWYIVYAKEAGDHSITLYEVTEGAVKIGEEWLPDTIATKADLEAAIGAAISASY